MRKIITVLMVAGLLLTAAAVYAEETVLFDYENGLEGWEVPDWAYEKPDHVQKAIAPSDMYSSSGNFSLEMDVDFPGGRWTGAIVEIMQFFDWTDYSKIACDIYIPEDAPRGLKSVIILTVGDAWKWVEMSRSYDLVPGEWTTLTADLTPGSIDWRRVQVDDAFRQDVRKIDIRVHSNNKPAYTGPIYIDNIRVIK
ncbi:MAG: glycan-binding surface protein [Candidatus Omnitrophota bacterium]